MARQPGKPEAIYDLVFHLTWLDEALTANGDKREALATGQRVISLIDRLKQIDPDNMLWREQEMQVHVRIADKFAALGDSNRSDLHWAIARKINAKLVSNDSANALWSNYQKRLFSTNGGERHD